jgi:cellulose synthase operon protein C
MKIYINLRFVLYSLACFAVLGVGVYFLHKWQAQRQAGLFLAKAREAESNGNVGKALDLYGKYLVFVPKDIDAQSQYGSLLADVHAYDRACRAFEAVLRRDPTQSDIRRKAVKAAMAIGRMSDARDHLKNYLRKEFPDDAELLDLEGRCQASAGEYNDAASSFETAIARDPTRLTAYIQLIGILSMSRDELSLNREDRLKHLPAKLRETLNSDNDWAEKAADYWTDRLVDANPKVSQAYLFQGYRRFGKAVQARGKDQSAALDALIAGLLNGAVQDAEAVLKLRPDDPAALHLAAISCQAAKQFDKAQEYALRGVKAAPKDYRMYEVLAQLARAKQQPDEALKWLKLGIDADGPRHLWWELGSLQIAKGQFDEARETAKVLRTKVFPSESAASAAQVAAGLYADLLEAKIAQDQGHWLDAAKRFGSVGQELKSAPDLASQAFYFLGKSYEQLADAESALKAYRQAVDADKLWIPAREALAASLASLGRIDEAFEEQSSLTKLKNASSEAWVGLIRLSIIRTARLPLEQRNWTGTADLLDHFAARAGKSPAVPLLRAELLVAQGRAAEAEKLLAMERSKDPKEIAFWIAEADLALRDNGLDRAKQILDEAEKQFGDRVLLRLARAQYLARKGEKGAAEQLRQLAEKTKEFSRPDQLRLWRGLARAALVVDDAAQAERLCRLLMAELPSDLRVRLELFDLAAQTKDFPLMDAALDEIRQVENGGPIWHYAQALRLILSAEKDRGKTVGETGKSAADEKSRQADLQAALNHLDETLRLRPNWSRALILQGLVYEASQRDAAALAKYLEAIQHGDSSPDVARRALRLLFAKGKYADANSLLRQLESQQVPFTTDLFREQSRVLGGLQDYSGALNAAQRAAADSKDYRDYLWLGQVCSILGRRDEAEKALVQANKLDDKAPETWVALVRFFAASDRKDRAEKALADARKKIPAAAAPLALAECLEILVKRDDAGQQLAKAAEQLAKIVGGQIKGTPQQIADARSALARVRADQGGYQNRLEAVRLVDENLADAPSSTDNLRLKSRLLAELPQLARRREAIAILENLVKDPKNAAADDRFRLAQLDLASGDWNKARQQMLALLAAHGEQPQYVAAYAQALLDHNEAGEAQAWVDRLEQLAPDNPGTAQLRAEIQFRGGHIDDAIATLAKFVKQAPAGATEHWARMLLAAAQLEAMGLRPSGADRTATAAATEDAQRLAAAAAIALQQAERGYRKCAADDPQRALVLVDFLIRQKRFDEALQLADEAAKTAEPPRIVATCELLLHQPGITAAQLDRLAAIVSAALERGDTAKRARPASLLLAMAELCEAKEDYAQAESLYREILQKDPSFVPALNNLACLLALSGRQLDDAKNLVEKAITAVGPHPALLDTRASVYLAMGQAEKAVADMQEVLQQHPAANRYFHLALAQNKLGRTADTADSLLKARTMQLRPESLHPLERPVYAELVKAAN